MPYTLLKRRFFIVWIRLICLSIGIGHIPQHHLSAQRSHSDSSSIARSKNNTPHLNLKASINLALEKAMTNPDSAFQIIENIYPQVKTSKNQELHAEVLYALGRIYENRQQLDSALVKYSESMKLATSINNSPHVASCLIQIGYVHHEKNESHKGLEYMKQALAMAEDTGDKELEAKAANGIGRIYSFLADFDSSNIYLNRALVINESLGNKRGMAEIYTNIANNYGLSSQRVKAIENFLLSQNLMFELNDVSGICHTFRNIGVSYFFDGQYPEALQNIHEALKWVEGTDHHLDIIQNLDYLGEIYMTIEDFDNAQIYWGRAGEAYTKAFGDKINPDFIFKQGRAMLSQKKYSDAITVFQKVEILKHNMGQFIGGDFYWNLAHAYEMTSDYSAAESNYLKSVSLSQNTNNYLIKTKSLYGLGKLAEVKNNLNQALGYYHESFDLAQTAGLKENEMHAAAGLYRIHKKQNNPASALRYIEISTAIRDSLFSEESTREIAKLEAGFAFEKEKQELEFAQQKKLDHEANIKRLLWIALLVVGLVLAISLIYFRSKQKANAELSRLNEEILSQKSILENQKEKLEDLDIAKSRFFTNISHEFRTPLTIISGMTTQVIDDPQTWAKKGGQMIKQNSANLLNLVNQILELRKLESNELRLNLIQADVIPYLRYLSDSYESYAKSKGLNLQFISAVDKLIMDYDPEKLLRIVSNLLSNAIKFTPHDGYIKLCLKQITDHNQSYLQFEVEDNGTGIDADQIAHIFDRFYQADDSSTRKEEGTGIGLALTRELVKLLKGDIVVKSIPDEGTTFTVTLPISNDSPLQEDFSTLIDHIAQPTIGISSALSDNQNNALTVANTEDLPTLLIVEDNPGIRQFLVACLENNYQLETASDGQEGIDMALEMVPDLIISDVMMPVKDGFALCETLKNDQRTSHVPIILLTAKADFESKISGLKTGADAYLTKPFEREELMVRLEKLFELRQKLQARYRTFDHEAQPQNKEDEFVQKVRQSVLDNMSDETFGITQLCQAVTLSRAQLHNKLKALTGQSTSLFVRSIRLHAAKKLLESTDMNVSEVGYEVGFKNPSYFSSSYQEEFGVPPSQARK